MALCKIKSILYGPAFIERETQNATFSERKMIRQSRWYAQVNFDIYFNDLDRASDISRGRGDTNFK